MSYTALYRKFRPLTFQEMVGQEQITKTLKNQLIADRVGHAYLFTGGRGTGKTSAAKIMARAVNCLRPVDGEPCNECEMCRAILDGSLTDVVEMDAASNNGVDDIRAIRDEVNFLPSSAKYRIYIIDEVHMLSTGAFNALLKTLEEPPKHVKFILATTEPQKLPATILSRCQRFDFKRIPVSDIIKRLQKICTETDIKITDEAIKMIAVLAEGALRDAISILERCVQDEIDLIDENQIRDLVGIPKLDYIREIVQNILNKNPQGALEISDNLINEGKDLDNFLWEIIKYVRDILVYKTTKTLNLYSEEEKKNILEISKIADEKKLLDLIYNLSEVAAQMKWSTQKIIVFQAGIIKASMEKEIEHAVIEKTTKTEKPIKVEDEPSKPIKKESKVQVKSINIEKGKNLECWQSILDKIKQAGKVMIYTNLIGTKAIQLDDLSVGVYFQKMSAFAKSVLDEYENKALIEKLISMELGKTMKVKYIEANSNPDKKQVSDLEKLDIPINIIDE